MLEKLTAMQDRLFQGCLKSSLPFRIDSSRDEAAGDVDKDARTNKLLLVCFLVCVCVCLFVAFFFAKKFL